MPGGGAASTRCFGCIAAALLSAASSANAGLWDVDIDLDPAPAPDKGPPFSAHATRDRSQLPHEVAAIMGAYVGFTLMLGTLLLTVGRRLRKQAQAVADRPQEMVTQMNKALDRFPAKSPGRLRSVLGGSIKSGCESIRSVARSSYGSPGMASVASFDPSIVERDRQNQHDALAQIYGQVYAHDEQMSPQEPPMSPNHPVNLVRGRVRTGEPSTGPRSPTSPRSPGFVAMYPKDYNGPTSPYYYEQPQSPFAAYRDTRTASRGSHETEETTTSGPGALGKGVRRLKDHGLTITAPLRRDHNSDGARTPLSPRTYMDPGVPPEPPTAGSTNSQYPPTTPGTAGTFESDTLPGAREAPSAYAQPTETPTKPPAVITPRHFIAPAPSKRSSGSPVSSTNHPLPLRAYNDQVKQQQWQPGTSPRAFPLPAALRSPSAAMTGSMRSPGAMLSPTYLQSPAIVRREVEYGRARFGGPLTAGPATPYSPYMREAMVTPITPRLTTRAERKQREREDKGMTLEEDQVADEKDMWGDAY